MGDIILWRKQVRIIMILAAEFSISAERALNLFYSTKTYREFSDRKYGLKLMSDGTLSKRCRRTARKKYVSCHDYKAWGKACFSCNKPHMPHYLLPSGRTLVFMD